MLKNYVIWVIFKQLLDSVESLSFGRESSGHFLVPAHSPFKKNLRCATQVALSRLPIRLIEGPFRRLRSAIRYFIAPNRELLA